MFMRVTFGVAAIGFLAFCGASAAFAQGWSEQIPLKFGIAGPGGNLLATELYRRQLMYNNSTVAIGVFNSTMNACSLGGGCLGGGGGGGGVSGVTGSTQVSTPSMNSTTNNPVLNVTINGSNNGPVTITNPTQGGMSDNTIKQSSDGSTIGSTNTQATGGKQTSNSGVGKIVSPPSPPLNASLNSLPGGGGVVPYYPGKSSFLNGSQ